MKPPKRSCLTCARLASSTTGAGIEPAVSEPGTSLPICGVTLISTPLIGDTRVELRIDQVQDQCGQTDRHDDAEDGALDQEPVRLPDRGEQHGPDPRIAEHDLDQDTAGHDLAERQRE